MTLKTWSNFSKKINSTLQPTGQSRDYTVYLKENTSIEKPVFILGTGIDSGINYCQCFGNYYFVDDIVMISADQVEVHCTLDVLATHKTAIGAYSAFIERAASAHDQWIIDNAISAEQNIVSETMATTDILGADQTGCYIVRCVSPSQDSPTGIASYVMSKRELNALLDFVTTENNFPDVLTDSIIKSFFNPFQYILSIMWFPMKRNDLPGQDSNLRLGWWDVPYPTTPGSTAWKLLTSGSYYANVQVNKPTAYYTQDFRAHHPSFTNLQACVPGMGNIDLDPAALDADLYAETCVDYVTGNMNVILTERGSQAGVVVNRDPFASFSAQVGIPIQTGQWQGMGASVVAAGAANTGNAVMDVLSDLGQSVIAAGADFISAVSAPVKGILNIGGSNQNVYGSTGNMSVLIEHPQLILYQRAYGSGDIPNTVYGRPLCKNRVISTLSGFIKCQGASVPLAAPDTETQAVNNYLNSGFYYE